MKSDTIRLEVYGCCKCQIYHYSIDPIYKEHIYFQSKHGIRSASWSELGPIPTLPPYES